MVDMLFTEISNQPTIEAGVFTSQTSFHAFIHVRIEWCFFETLNEVLC